MQLCIVLFKRFKFSYLPTAWYFNTSWILDICQNWLQQWKFRLNHVCIQRRIENIARGTTDPEIDSVTCISCKFGNQMVPLVLVANLTTRWHHLHQLQICPPDGTTCISCTIDHQMAPLVFISCIFGHQVAQFGLVWSSGGTRHQWRTDIRTQRSGPRFTWVW